jgi:hypothetical protein
VVLQSFTWGYSEPLSNICSKMLQENSMQTQHETVIDWPESPWKQSNLSLHTTGSMRSSKIRRHYSELPSKPRLWTCQTKHKQKTTTSALSTTRKLLFLWNYRSCCWSLKQMNSMLAHWGVRTKRDLEPLHGSDPFLHVEKTQKNPISIELLGLNFVEIVFCYVILHSFVQRICTRM